MPSPDEGPEQSAITADRRQQLISALRRLPLAYRGVITLALEGFSCAEIADLLGISTNAAAIRLTRAKALLRQQLRHGT